MRNIDDLILLADLARKLGKAEATVQKYCRTGKFPHVKIGHDIYFTPDHIEAIVLKFERLPARAKGQSRGKPSAAFPLVLLRGETG